jgi:hypothetical protein
MRKALLPMIASLALCGAATAALIATNARADQSGRKPVMLALAGQDSQSIGDTAAPSADGGPGRDMMRDNPARRAQFCKDMYARKVGELAFLGAKLSLTANQEPLFDHWKQARLDIAKQHQDACSSHEMHKPGDRPGLVDRMNTEETMLKKRIADLDAEKPSLTAFYDSLTPAQKQEFGRAAMRRRAERMHMMVGMMGRPRPPELGGRMGRGPMGGPMGDAPPPPPAPAQ